MLTAMMCLVCAFVVACDGANDNKVSISFQTGVGAPIETVKLDKGQEYTLPVPETVGYSFEGWYENDAFSGSAVEKITAESNKTFYANWAQAYAVTLDLNGGTLSNAKTLYLKAGANIYDAVSGYLPAKSGMQFGAWFQGDNELARNARMPEGAVTLTARYKVRYTVECWLQTVDGESYEKAEDITGYEYAGTVFTSEQKLQGFRETANENSVTTLTLSDDAGNNVFKHYFDRLDITVTYNSNYPVQIENQVSSTVVKYGTTLEVPADKFALSGYCLVGWSTSATGDIVYKADAVNALLYNKDGSTPENDSFVPERNMTLYAVWSQGMFDLFGGSDSIYLFDEQSDEIYLSRGGLFFKGEYNSENKTFLFVDAKDDVLLEGKIVENGAFVYGDPARAEAPATLFTYIQGPISTTMLYFDMYDGVTLSVDDGTGKTTQSKGTFEVDLESGYYVITFDDGELAGQTLTILLGYVGEQYVFMIRNDEELDMGVLACFAFNGTELVPQSNNLNAMILTGFGIAYMNNGTSQLSSYYYVVDKNDPELITLLTSGGSVYQTVRLMEVGGQKGYMVYRSANKIEFTTEDESATLSLDGVINAKYTKDGNTVEGYYTIGTSLFGGNLITVYAGEQTLKFAVTSKTIEIPGEDGTTTSKTTYVLTEKLSGYAEFNYVDEVTVYRTPIIVLDAEQAGQAIVYSYTTDQKYVKTLIGSYAYDETTGRYVFTVKENKINGEAAYDEKGEAWLFTTDETAEGAQAFTPYDLTHVEAFVFGLNLYYYQSAMSSGTYKVVYWYEQTENGETQDNATYYTSAKGDKLTLVGGFAFVSTNGMNIVGNYTTRDDGITAVAVIQSSGVAYLYLEIYEESKTFVVLEHSPYTAYAYYENGKYSQKETLAFDGKGGATYTQTVENEDGESETKTYVGTVEALEKPNEFNAQIYKFTAEGMEFEYIALSTSSMRLFAKANDTYTGEYLSEDGVLVLDGFGFNVRYTDSEGNVYSGMYVVAEENVIVMTLSSSGQTVYFDILSGTSFTRRGFEFGTYLYSDNQATYDIMFTLDGYGKLTVSDLVLNEETNAVEAAAVDENGTYAVEEDKVTVKYVRDGKQIELSGKLGTMTSGSNTYRVFITIHDESAHTFINEKDWSILVTDNVGNATKYSKNGKTEKGRFILITENMMYYVNNDATDACIYRYNVEKGVATPVTFSPIGYYTKDFESLLFNKYGFAIFNATTRYYYDVVDGTVLIYHQDPENEKANRYGFVEENFGEFTAEKVYNGKTYYENSGFPISFVRAEEGKDKYPVPYTQTTKAPLETLIFTPSGTPEFSVTGSVLIAGTQYACTVVRELNEDGTYSMYAVVASYRFDITFEYSGKSGNTYDITAMSWTSTMPSYAWLDMYLIGSMFGVQVPNTYGVITMRREFNEAGEMTVDYVSGEFGPESKLLDSNGNLIELDKAEYKTYSSYYCAAVTATDGYEYLLYFVPQKHSSFGITAYYVVGLARVEKLTTSNGYTVITERIVASDSKNNVGGMMSLKLMKGEDVIDYEYAYIDNGTYYLIVRDKDENGKVTSTVYYKIGLVEKQPALDEAAPTVKFYESATVTVENITNKFSASGKTIVDIDENNVIRFIDIDGETHLIIECAYDEETWTYTVTDTAGKTYKVEVGEDDVITLSVVVTSSK